MDSKEKTVIEEVVDALEAVVDPELGISIVKLGLIREVFDYSKDSDIEEGIEVVMTLTSPLCPFADAIIEDVENVVSSLGYGDCKVTLTFNPPWEATEELKLMLGL